MSVRILNAKARDSGWRTFSLTFIESEGLNTSCPSRWECNLRISVWTVNCFADESASTFCVPYQCSTSKVFSQLGTNYQHATYSQFIISPYRLCLLFGFWNWSGNKPNEDAGVRAFSLVSEVRRLLLTRACLARVETLSIAEKLIERDTVPP